MARHAGLLLLVLVVGCVRSGYVHDGGQVDGGADAATDGGVDAATDGGADAATDGGADAATDGGADASTAGPVELSLSDAVLESVVVDLTLGGAMLVRGAGFALAATRLPTAQSSRAACARGETFFVGGGSPAYPSYSSCTTEFLSYDPITDSLSVAGALTEPIQGLKLLVHPDGNLYKVMGDCGDSAEEPRVYNFNEGAGLFDYVGNFPSGAMYFAGGVLTASTGEELIVRAGGYGTGPLYDVVQVFDPQAGSGTQLGVTLPSGRCLLGGGAVVDQVLYVFGGNTQSSGCALPSTETSDPLLDEIAEVKIAPAEEVVSTRTLPTSLAGTCAVAREDGTIVLFGGVAYDEAAPGNFTRRTLADVYLFDPATGAVTPHTESLPVPRAGLACAENDAGRIFLFGGADTELGATDEIWMFEPYAATGRLTSAVLDAQRPSARWYDLVVDADTPPGTSLELEVRAAEDRGSLEAGAWQAVTTSLPSGRYLQLRASLGSTTRYLSPALRSINVSYDGT